LTRRRIKSRSAPRRDRGLTPPEAQITLIHPGIPAMVLFNYATKEITAKIVYYGPGLCGKTTNLQFIYDSLPSNNKSKMLSLATKTDRTLFFDFLPLDLGKIRGMRTKLQLYTVPGQVYYNSTRQLVLKGADGIVFVADSQDFALDANARVAAEPRGQPQAAGRPHPRDSARPPVQQTRSAERAAGEGDRRRDQQAAACRRSSRWRRPASASRRR
jgi:GTPase SAR1 family protein